MWFCNGIVGVTLTFPLLVTMATSMATGNPTDGHSHTHPLLILSFDGFRFDFFNLAKETPALDQLKAEGVSVPYMRNQFVTKTFPNHMSIATGLYLESHGVVDNEIWDPLYNLSLKVNSRLFWDPDNRTLPIWTLNEMTTGHHSGVMMWPGSDHPYQEKLPAKVVSWNDSIPFSWRIDQVLNWMTTDPELSLVLMYFEEPDEYAHAFGPDSKEVKDKVEKLDKATAYLVEGLKKKGLYDLVNLVILSDHGFQGVHGLKDMVNISSIVDPALYDQHGSTPVLHLRVKDKGRIQEVYGKLKEAQSSRSLNFTVYKKEELEADSGEKRWHYGKNRRIGDIVLVADLGVVFEDFAESIQWYDKKFGRTPSPDNIYGVHGYDNSLLPMHPFFLAHGPAFKTAFVGAPFDNVDLFPLFCHLLGITPPGNNGSLENVVQFFSLKGHAHSVGSDVVGWAIAAGVMLGILVLLGIFTLLTSSSYEFRSRPDHTYRYVANADNESEEERAGTPTYTGNSEGGNRALGEWVDKREEAQALLATHQV